MRQTWPLLIAVGAVGALAGAAIAGRPIPEDPFVIDPARVVEPTTPTTSLAVPTSIETTSFGAISTQVATTTTAAPATTAPQATPPPTTAPVESSSSTPPTEIDRRTLRLVVANGDGRAGLAKMNGTRLEALGYQRVDLGDATQYVLFTIVYYREGLESAAVAVARDLGVEGVALQPYPVGPQGPVTNSDAEGDVIVVLGPNAPG